MKNYPWFNGAIILMFSLWFFYINSIESAIGNTLQCKGKGVKIKEIPIDPKDPTQTMNIFVCKEKG